MPITEVATDQAMGPTTQGIIPSTIITIAKRRMKITHITMEIPLEPLETIPITNLR